MNEEEQLLADARDMEEEDQTLPESELSITDSKLLLVFCTRLNKLAM